MEFIVRQSLVPTSLLCFVQCCRIALILALRVFDSDSLVSTSCNVNPLNPELNPICSLLALLGANHFLHVSRIKVTSLTLRLLMSYIYDISSLRVNTSAHCSGRKQVKG